jgi:hypothetical protein
VLLGDALDMQRTAAVLHAPGDPVGLGAASEVRERGAQVQPDELELVGLGAARRCSPAA